MSTITLKIEKDLLEKVKKKAKKMYPNRNIKKYAEAVREVLISFTLETQKNDQQVPSTKLNSSKLSQEGQ